MKTNTLIKEIYLELDKSDKDVFKYIPDDPTSFECIQVNNESSLTILIKFPNFYCLAKHRGKGSNLAGYSEDHYSLIRSYLLIAGVPFTD